MKKKNFNMKVSALAMATVLAVGSVGVTAGQEKVYAATSQSMISKVVSTENQKVLVYYKRASNTSWTNAYIHYKVNGAWTTTPGMKMTKESNGYWSFSIDLEDSSSATVCFNNGKGSWDNNSGKNYKVGAGTVEVDQTKKTVTTLATPAPVKTDAPATQSPTPTATQTVTTASPTPTQVVTSSPDVENNIVTVYYKRSTNTSWADAYVHYKVNGVWTVSPGVKMNFIEKGYWGSTISLNKYNSLTLCFNNGKGSWDNNSKKNYTIGTGVYLIDQSKKTVTKLATQAPATVAPTAEPTKEPTVAPTEVPTQEPTVAPTAVPTTVPTTVPTAVPTQEPTVAPTVEPTEVPTQEPTVAPTVVPTAEPTATPTVTPTIEPTKEPTYVKMDATGIEFNRAMGFVVSFFGDCHLTYEELKHIQDNPNYRDRLSTSGVLNIVKTEVAPVIGKSARVDLNAEGTLQMYSLWDNVVYLYDSTNSDYIKFPEDCSHMFANLSHLQWFAWNECYDISDVKDMSYMFEKVCGDPWYFDGEEWQPFVDLGTDFDTSNVENMTGMFYACGECRGVRLNLGAKFDTSKVTNMSHMFEYCGMGQESELYWSDNFDTRNVRDMSYMFHDSFWYNYSLKLCDEFDTSNVVDMTSMFEGCGRAGMTVIRLGKNFNTNSLEKADHLFEDLGSDVNDNCFVYIKPECVGKLESLGVTYPDYVIVCEEV